MYTDEMKAQAEQSLKEGRTLNDIGNDVVDALFTVHLHMGPGLAESVYQECLMLELARREIPNRTQEPINIDYRGEPLDQFYVADLVVEGRVIVELKSVMELLPIHEAQLINYLKLTKLKLGYLVNFNVPLIKDGIKRRKNGFAEE